ncbi:MAG TPA: NADH-quinone oxidoreductase subunit NuoK [bacterium]|nr:NADH-quinone oxidoreductase subunit NuoK [bacterium]
MSHVPVSHFLWFALALFSVGLFGVLARKNAISVLLGVEMMLNAVNVNYLAFAKYWNWNGLTGPVFVIFIITVGAAEVAVALAIVISVYRQWKSANVDEVRELRG